MEESSLEDVIRKVNRKIEKKASQTRINIILSISKAFKETRHIEAASANKDHTRMGHIVFQKAKDQMEEWEKEIVQQGAMRGIKTNDGRKVTWID